MRQLHALAEAELKLSFHQKRLSEIDAKVTLTSIPFLFSCQMQEHVCVSAKQMYLQMCHQSQF